MTLTDTNYQVLYQKYKNKYLKLKSKIQYGGNLLKPTDLFMSYISFYLSQPFEYCGNFVIVNDELVFHGNPNTGNSEGRLHCYYNFYSAFIWHTHPKGSKYYPSIEDIIKVLKHQEIYYSYIFTEFGYWVLYHEGIYEKWDSENLTRFLSECNDKFYFGTEEGRKYNLEMIETYIKWLDGVFGLNNGFRIFWKSY